jgi:hypothetical protein
LIVPTVLILWKIKNPLVLKKKKGRAKFIVGPVGDRPQLAHVDTHTHNTIVLGRKGPAKKEEEGGAWLERRGAGGAPFPQCVCVCVLSYKLPTPLPLLLQCRGGRRLSQVVFTQLKRQITNRIISFSSQSTINVHSLSFSVVLGFKKRKNLVDEKKFVNFCRKCQIKFRGPLSHSEIIFTCEHVFTSHWILNVWLVLFDFYF